MEAPISGIAISKAGADRDGFVGSRDLLNDLDGGNGPTLHAVAVGYVMAQYDAMAQEAAIGPATLEQVVHHVRDWLAAHPELADRPAAGSIRAALRSLPQNDGADRAGQRRRPSRRNVAVRRGAAALLLCAASLAAGWGLESVFGEQTDHALRAVEVAEQAARISSLLLEERRYEKDLFINIGDRDRLEAYSRKWRRAHAGLAAALASARALELADEDREALREIDADLRAYVRGYEAVLAQIREGRIRTAQQANEAIARYKDAAHRIEAASNAIYERATQRKLRVT
jgi:hypothetical protein